MTAPPDKDELSEYYAAAESWTNDRIADQERSVRIAWIAAAAAGVLALIEGLALLLLIPLKQVVPYAVLVDRQTGHVQPLNLAKGETIKPDDALVRSMLAQYVTARESFNIASLKDNYRKVGLWSAGDARSQYIAASQASNPTSLLATVPRSSVISVDVRSISPLSQDTMLVRFSTSRADAGGAFSPQGTWAAVIRYRFSSADMSAANRLENPLGFQVVSYNRTAEIALQDQAVAPVTMTTAPAANQPSRMPATAIPNAGPSKAQGQ